MRIAEEQKRVLVTVIDDHVALVLPHSVLDRHAPDDEMAAILANMTEAIALAFGNEEAVAKFQRKYRRRTREEKNAKMVMSATKYFAAVGNDGMRLVVWGIGHSEVEALDDAVAQDEGSTGHDQYEVHEITVAQAEAIKRGDVSWPST